MALSRQATLAPLFGLRATEIILQSYDVSLAEVLASLHFDHHQWPGIGIFQAMDGSYWNKGSSIRFEQKHAVAIGHTRRPFHHNPMFTATMMLLEAQALPRKDLKALYLIRGPHLQ